MNIEHLKTLRQYELEQIVPFIPAAASILELGAGAGWQAKLLEERGFTVKAVDLPDNSPYRAHRVFPIIDYDGLHIPFSDESFDVVFSSHVLEHVTELEILLSEMRRVLKPNGMAIHIMPSATWRILTTLLHYPGVLKEVYNKLSVKNASESSSNTSAPKRALHEYLLRFLYPHRHGERGNVWSEIYFFSRCYWRQAFEKRGWKLEKISPTGIVYSGYSLFDSHLSITKRRLLAGILGSSSITYVTKPYSLS